MERIDESVADLTGREGGRLADRLPLLEIFSIFPSKNERKTRSYYLKRALKIDFCL
jgi:hypothetical protein